MAEATVSTMSTWSTSPTRHDLAVRNEADSSREVNVSYGMYASHDVNVGSEMNTSHEVNGSRGMIASHDVKAPHKVSKSSVTHEPLIKLTNVQFTYDGEHQVLRDVSLAIRQGERMALLGNNGAGKSTLCRLLTGIAKPTAGDIRLHGERINDWSIRRRAQHIGYVMQNPNHMVTQHMIADEVALGLRMQGLPEEEIRCNVEATLQICGLSGYRTWPISALSYGQKKRVTIASILVMRPSLIVLDEPTAGQDYRHYTDFMRFITKLADSGISFLFITHDMHVALEYTERAAVLCNGELIAVGDTVQVLTDTTTMARANLNETSLSALARQTGVADPTEFVRHFLRQERLLRVQLGGER
ncbi:ABC transporter ATP-binding protein [Paenibacillus sp. 481]|nr:ABC transporter ATP-binding protein [Paenibacillus sp. 481]